jgi:hypothetical protein
MDAREFAKKEAEAKAAEKAREEYHVLLALAALFHAARIVRSPDNGVAINPAASFSDAEAFMAEAIKLEPKP